MNRLLFLTAIILVCLPSEAQDFGGPKQEAVSGQNAAIRATNEALAAHDYEKALQLIKPLAEASPRDARLQFDLGTAQDALDQGTSAEASYRAAIEDAAGFLEPRVALGLLLARAGRMADARSTFVAAVAIAPAQNATEAQKTLQARALRALARIDQKERPEEARRELLGALAISPETPDDTLLTAELAEGASNGSQPAEAAYRRVLTDSPDDPAATAGLAHLLAGEKKFVDAESLLMGALKAHPGEPRLSFELVSVYSASGKETEAIGLLEKLHSAEPGDLNLSRVLAELYLDQKLYAKAEPLLAGMSAQHTDDGTLADWHAQALLHLHQPAAAERALSRVVTSPAFFRNTQEWGDAAADLAFAASQNNEPAKTLQVLQIRAKVLPPTPPIEFLTAISEDKLHHVVEAVQAYKSFLAASKGDHPDEEFEARHRLVALDHRK